MSDVSFSSDASFNRYLFEYRHGETDWGIEIQARSPEEARERIKALTWARYQGEIKHSFTIPTGVSIIDRIRRLMRSFF